MPSLISDKGKVASPAFYGKTKTVSPAKSSSNLPIYAVLVVIGVGLVFFLRKRSSNVQTGPLLTLAPNGQTDTSAIANLTQSVDALTLRGGASTPLTPSPNS
jgi:hypothetical protein